MAYFTLISYKHKYILITFPKSGCTLIRRSFLELNRDDDALKDCISSLAKKNGLVNIAEDMLEQFIQLGFSLTPEDLKTKYTGYKIICVYRETYGRVVSMFFNKFAGVYDDETVKHLPLLWKHYYRISNDVATFRKFVNWLKDKKNSDIHYQEQILPDWIKPHKIIEIADINNLFVGIDGKVDVEANKILKKIGRVNSLKKNKDMKGMYADYDFKDDPLNLDVQNNGVPEYHMMYDQPLIDKVKAIYKKEIEYYAYHA